MSTKQPVRIQHFSDALCVWAYVAQVRVQELQTNFGDQVEVSFHFVDVFGDTANKCKPGYGDFVRKVADRFDHVEVNPATWERDVPPSSVGCHLFLRAVGVVAGDEAFARVTAAVREAFFRDARNVATAEVQDELAAAAGLDPSAVRACIADGRACAALSADARIARDLHVQTSPSLVFNEGRQRLYGNVGYRVIEANVRELLHRPANTEASWC